MPLSFINVDISQCLQAISFPFTDCALSKAKMNGCTLCFLCSQMFTLCTTLTDRGLFVCIGLMNCFSWESFTEMSRNIYCFVRANEAWRFGDRTQTALVHPS